MPATAKALLSKITQPIPRLSKAGMPSRSEGWGGLFKDEQYRLIRSASRASIRLLRVFEQTTPALRAFPSLLRRGMSQNRTYCHHHRSKRLPVAGLRNQLNSGGRSQSDLKL